MGAPNIVKNYNQTCFRQLLILLSRNSSKLYIQKFAISHINQKSYQHKGSKNKKMSIFAFTLNVSL